MAPKKNIKMDLGSFLADDTLGGSWADEDVDMKSIGVNATTAAVPDRPPVTSAYEQSSGSSSRFQDRMAGDDHSRPERKEFPIPDQPPYKARIANLPWEINEDDVAEFFEKRMQAQGIVTEVKLPSENGRLKGFGFVTFTERSVLEEALQLNTADFNGRRIYVNVAAPQKQDVFDMDWRSSRTGPQSSEGGRRPRREEAELDWGSARSEEARLPPRERSRRGPPTGDRPPRREEPDLDWGSARTEEAKLPPRERSRRTPSDRPPRRDGPELDWGSARSEEAKLPPRERSRRTPSDRPPRRQEPELDWGSARTEEAKLPPRERSNRKPRKTDDLDWNTARGTSNNSNNNSNNDKSKKTDEESKSQGPQKSLYDVLTIEGESDEEKSEQIEKVVEKVVEPVKTESLEKATADLSLKEEDGWEVVRK